MNKPKDKISDNFHIGNKLLNFRQLFIPKSGYAIHKNEMFLNSNQHDHMTRFIAHNKSPALRNNLSCCQMNFVYKLY